MRPRLPAGAFSAALPLRADSCIFPSRAPLGKTGYGAKPHHHAYSAGLATRGCGIRCEDYFPGSASHSSLTHPCKHVSTRLDVMQVRFPSLRLTTDWIPHEGCIVLLSRVR